MSPSKKKTDEKYRGRKRCETKRYLSVSLRRLGYLVVRGRQYGSPMLQWETLETRGQLCGSTRPRSPISAGNKRLPRGTFESQLASFHRLSMTS